MHIPDGFIDGPVSLAAGAAAVGAVSVAARKVTAELDDRDVPLAGLVAAYLFALQMVNFPIAHGTSGHLLGGCLAAALVGPWLAVVVMAVVFLVQALVFADGGLTALGLNVLVMGVTTVVVGWGATRGAARWLPIPAAVAIGAWASVVAGALAFAGCYALGGAAGIELAPLTAAMVGVHALIGLGEAAISAMTVRAVLGVRPDLVRARPVLQGV